MIITACVLIPIGIIEMGEGVSPSLSRNGSPIANYLLVSVLFSGEHGFYGGLNLLVIQTEEGCSLKRPSIGSYDHEGLTSRGSPLQKWVSPVSLPRKWVKTH